MPWLKYGGYIRATLNDTISNIVYNPEVVFILSRPWHSQPLLCEQCMFYGSISTWLCLLDSGIRKGHSSWSQWTHKARSEGGFVGMGVYIQLGRLIVKITGIIYLLLFFYILQILFLDIMCMSLRMFLRKYCYVFSPLLIVLITEKN